MAATLVSQNNEAAAMLVSQTNPVGVELFSYANAFFCSRNLRRCWPRESKRPTGLLSNTTNLHVHYTFLVHFCDHGYDVKMPKLTFYGGREQAATNFSFSF